MTYIQAGTMPILDPAVISQFLRANYCPGVASVHPVGAGMFSQAFSFAVGRREYVLRVNAFEEDLRKDAFAYRHFRAPGLPIPRVVRLGPFEGSRHYIITERCRGRILDEMGAEEVREILPGLFHSLDIIHGVDVSGYPGWGLASAQGRGRFDSWHSYRLSLYNQKFEETWTDLARRTFLEGEVYQALLGEMVRLLAFCPEDKYLIHGDFGFDNVMSDGRTITGVLDWAEFGLGDFVYDVAYLDFWSKEIPYGALWRERAAARGQDVPHFEERMRCYQLGIGLDGMRIDAALGNEREYVRTRERTRSVLRPGMRSSSDWTQ